jgi:anti-sigma-K factor RskA
MMNWDQQLKLQAYLDGELPEGDRRAVESRLAQDAGAGALLAELRQTNAALAGFESEMKLPETREFFWSKIERDIRRQERTPQREEQPSWLWWVGWRRLLVPAGAVAALAILLVSLWTNLPGGGPGSGIVAAFDDDYAFTYRDQSQGTTLVWLSYAADDKFQEGDFEETIQD